MPVSYHAEGEIPADRFEGRDDDYVSRPGWYVWLASRDADGPCGPFDTEAEALDFYLLCSGD